MVASSAATFFAGYLFLASASPVVEPPARDHAIPTAATAVGYLESCAGPPSCNLADLLRRRALPVPKPAERWFGDRAVMASAVSHGDADKPRAERPVVLPMLLKERWFSRRIITAAVAVPEPSPARLPMAHQERWFGDRIVAATATVVAASSASPARVSMALKERWLGDRIVAAAEKRAAVIPVRTPMVVPMAVKERWFRPRTFTAADAGPPPSPKYTGGAILPKGGGRQQIGKPYQVAGRWYTPREEPGYDVTGIASWYGPAFHRRMTSNGEWFDMDFLSAAHPTLPLPSYVKVTNIDNGGEIIVRVNDRGPFADDRIIDLSKKCAEVLGFKDRGTTNVRVQYIGAAPLDDNGSHLRAVNRELRRGTAFERMLAAADRTLRTVAAADAKPGQSF